MGVKGEAGAAGEGVEASARFENLVIEALIEDRGDSRLMIYSHFETAYYLTKGVLRGRFDGAREHDRFACSSSFAFIFWWVYAFWGLH